MVTEKLFGQSGALDGLRRVLPYLASLVFLGVFLMATAKEGVGVSTDSVFYAGAAQSFRDSGSFQVPLTWWDEDAATAPLSHFPPLLPLVLAGLSALLKTDPVTAGRWLNAACIFLTSLALLCPLANGFLQFFVVTALIAGSSFIDLHLWLFSEPLFLLLAVLCFWLGVGLLQGGIAYRGLVLLAVTCGLATLTRYAGVFLYIGFTAVFLLYPTDWKHKIKLLCLFTGGYVLTVLPWFLWLSATGSAARHLSLYSHGFGNQILKGLIPTIAHWLIPYWLPKAIQVVLFLGGLAWVAMSIARRYLTAGDAFLRSPLYLSLVLGTVYLSFVAASRLFADPAIPFDARILLPFLLFAALALGYLLEALSGKSIGAVIVLAILALTAVGNIRAETAGLRWAARYGNGYNNRYWKTSETIAWLRRLPEGVTIYSNAPDVICALLPVTAKFTLPRWQADSLPAFAQRVAETAPAVVVLFDDLHDAGWILPRKAYDELKSDATRDFGDSLVLSWGLPAGAPSLSD